MRLRKKTLISDDVAHRLSTNTLSNSKRIQRWGNFIAGFSIEFVEQCLSGMKPESKPGFILDPFAGCGTTLVAAKNLGFSTVGYELHPVFHAISSGKLHHYAHDAADQVLTVLREGGRPIPWSADASKFLSKLFHDENLSSIRKAAGSLSKAPPDLQDLSVVMLLKACELACGSQTDGIYKAPTTIKKYIPFAQALERVASEFSDDICSEWYRDHWVQTPPSTLFMESAECMESLDSESVACCITSPPYLNNFDYAEMTRMHLYLLGWCSNWRHISEAVRNHLITNTTTALNGKKTPMYQKAARESIPTPLLPELDQLTSSLAQERKTREGKKEYDYLVYPYYSQIAHVLANVFRTLCPGGKIHWVVADSALYGIHIETHEHTATIMRELGLNHVRIHFLRRRGHRWVLSKRDGAKKGLGEYHIEGEK